MQDHDKSADARITRKTRASAPHDGFAGPGHTAVEVFGPKALKATDPFVMLMDDRLDFHPGQPVGEPHPHAGLETVTLLVEGSLDDRDEGLLEEGDLAWMTAGKGVVHNEQVRATGRARILQLWVALPRAKRHLEPSLEFALLKSLPVRREAGVEARVYSGRSGKLISPTGNRVPMTIVDFRLQAGASVEQTLPASYTGLLYVLSGSIEADGLSLTEGDVGWLDAAKGDAETALDLRAGADGARVVLYAGQPIKEPIVHRGPFVAGSDAELSAFYAAFRAGAFKRVSEIVSAS